MCRDVTKEYFSEQNAERGDSNIFPPYTRKQLFRTVVSGKWYCEWLQSSMQYPLLVRRWGKRARKDPGIWQPERTRCEKCIASSASWFGVFHHLQGEGSERGEVCSQREQKDWLGRGRRQDNTSQVSIIRRSFLKSKSAPGPSATTSSAKRRAACSGGSHWSAYFLSFSLVGSSSPLWDVGGRRGGLLCLLQRRRMWMWHLEVTRSHSFKRWSIATAIAAQMVHCSSF